MPQYTEGLLSYRESLKGSKDLPGALFQWEQIGFSVKSSGVAGEAAVPAYDAVAGDDEGDGISSDGASDGAGG